MIRIERVDPITRKKTIIAEYTDPEQVEKIKAFIKLMLDKKKEQHAQITKEFLEKKAKEENATSY